MNAFPGFTRACAPRVLAVRLATNISSRSVNPQLRHISSTTQLSAQPIELATTSTAEAPSEAPTLASISLSRASTDPNPLPSSQPPPRSPKQQQQQQKSQQRNPSHSTSSPFLLLATVSRTGTMTSTVQLTQKIQTFDTFLQKHYTRANRLLAHDPNPEGFLREGDVVEYGLFSEAEKNERENKRLTLESRLIEKGVIRLKTRRGKERDLKEVGVKKRGPKWVVRRVISPFGVGIDERMAV